MLVPVKPSGQTDASFGLAFNLRRFRLATLLRRLASTCDDLRGLALICVDVGRAQIWTQVDASFYRLATQLKSTQVDRK